MKQTGEGREQRRGNGIKEPSTQRGGKGLEKAALAIKVSNPVASAGLAKAAAGVAEARYAIEAQRKEAIARGLKCFANADRICGITGGVFSLHCFT